MLVALSERARRWASATDPWTNVYGGARTLLASSTFLTLCFNSTPTLFHVGVGLQVDPPFCGGGRSLSLFCMPLPLELARFVGIAILAIVMSGWRPRITGPLHWLVAFSLHASSSVADGGDNVCAVLTLLLLPITLTDPRRSHWSARPSGEPTTGELVQRMIALSAWLVIRLQVAGIYFHAAIGKAAVQEWVDGTALYYWLLHPTLGAAHWLAPILQHLLLNPFIVALLTWGALLLEIALFTALVVSRRWWPILLALGLCFHGGIMVVQGLVSFSIAMMGALVLYLRPPGQVFPLPLGLSPVREATHARLSPTPEPFARAKSR